MSLVSFASLHPVCQRDVRGRRTMRIEGGRKVKTCGCKLDSDGEHLSLCEFHEGYDLGIEYAEAMADQRCAERSGQASTS